MIDLIIISISIIIIIKKIILNRRSSQRLHTKKNSQKEIKKPASLGDKKFQPIDQKTVFLSWAQ